MNKNLYALAALALATTTAMGQQYKKMIVETSNGTPATEYNIGSIDQMQVRKSTESIDIKSKAGSELETHNLKEVKQIRFDYGCLKGYVDRTSGKANPNFKMAIAIEGWDFLGNKTVQDMTTENFQEFTLGNDMKYASVVRDNGDMDFTQVKKVIALAKEKGLTIYGHTLAWHSQQNIRYLTSLMADREDPNAPKDPNSTRTQIEFTCSKAGAYAWDAQAGITLDEPLAKGSQYVFEAEIKASTDADCGLWGTWEASPNRNEWNGTADVMYMEGKAIKTTWKTFKWEFKADYPIDKLSLVFGKHGGSITISDVKLTKQGSDVNLIKKADLSDGTATNWVNSGNAGKPVVSVVTGDRLASTVVDLVSNGNAEGTDTKNFYSTEKTVGPGACKIATGKGINSGNAFVVTAGSNPTNSWDTQFFIKLDKPVATGTELDVTFWYKADKAAKAETQTHAQPGGYLHWDGGLNVDFTTEWKKFEKTIKLTTDQTQGGSMQTFAFNLNVSSDANVYYFDEISIKTTEKAGVIPMTKEEKADAIAGAMERWIKGMMEATDGFVTTWDVVNEAIGGGGDDGQGNYALQHANNVDNNGVGGDNFFWQDVMGDIEYVRTAVACARKHFKGKPEDLKLFINDYNLESWWDGNKKAKSLVNWIKKWEADGVTKIDGIGTQMHVSCSMNKSEQKSREQHVVEMFKILAASGKMVKITELDMGMSDMNGQAVKTKNLTPEQHKMMADYYKFIVKAYFENVPVAQQYGITQWCMTDAPDNSGWRGGEPVGLWTQSFQRKEAYKGFAEGLYDGTHK